MNKRYEEGREPLFSEAGETLRKQYVWAKNEKGKNTCKKPNLLTSNKKLKVTQTNAISKTSSEKQVSTRSF